MFRLQVTIIRQIFQDMDMTWHIMDMSCSKLYIIEYIAVFWLKDILAVTTTQRDGSYKERRSSRNLLL